MFIFEKKITENLDSPSIINAGLSAALKLTVELIHNPVKSYPLIHEKRFSVHCDAVIFGNCMPVSKTRR